MKHRDYILPLGLWGGFLEVIAQILFHEFLFSSIFNAYLLK